MCTDNTIVYKTNQCEAFVITVSAYIKKQSYCGHIYKCLYFCRIARNRKKTIPPLRKHMNKLK